MIRWCLALAALAACGGNDVHFLPDASLAGCGLGTWTMTLTAGAGDCTTPGDTQSTTIHTTYMTGGGVAIEVVGDPTFTAMGTTADEGGGCRLQATLSSPATGGTENDTMSVLETDGAVSGFGAMSISGASACNQALTFSGTYTP